MEGKGASSRWLHGEVEREAGGSVHFAEAQRGCATSKLPFKNSTQKKNTEGLAGRAQTEAAGV